MGPVVRSSMAACGVLWVPGDDPVGFMWPDMCGLRRRALASWGAAQGQDLAGPTGGPHDLVDHIGRRRRPGNAGAAASRPADDRAVPATRAAGAERHGPGVA